MYLIKIMIIIILYVILIVAQSDYEDQLLDLKTQKQEQRFEIDIQIKLAFWSFCIPTQQISQYSIVRRQQLFHIKNLDNQKLIIAMYVNIDLYQETVSHNFYLQGMFEGQEGEEEEEEGGQEEEWKEQQEQQQYDPLQYEGTWILTMIIIKKKEIQIQTLNSNVINLFETYEELSNILFILGDSDLKILDIKLEKFLGRISKLIMIEQNYNYDDYFNNYKIPPQVEEEQIFELVPGIQIFDGQTQLKMEFDQVGKNFCISGWVKYDPKESDSWFTYLLLRLTTFKSYTSETRVGDEIVLIKVDFDFENTHNYTFISYHYATPLLQYINNYDSGWEIMIFDLEVLTNWHFVTFEYSNSWTIKSKCQISYLEGSEIIRRELYLGDEQYNNLFINTKYYAIIGSDNAEYFQKLKGQISNLIIQYNYENPKEYIQICHYSCLLCSGPSSYDCRSCPVNQNRIYLKDSNQCPCQYGYFEKNQICKSITDFSPTLILKNIEFNSNEIICPFGYFMLPEYESCIKCPQDYIRGFDLVCAECLLYPTKWYQKLICQSDYYILMKSENQFTYIKKERIPDDYELFFIDDNLELQYIEGAQKYCTPGDLECFEFNPNSLVSKQIYVKCNSNYFIEYYLCQCLPLQKGCLSGSLDGCYQCKDGYNQIRIENGYSYCEEIISNNCDQGYTFSSDLDKCIKCGNNCEICQYQYNQFDQGFPRCLRCVHHQKYYISINFTDCLENLIANCLYAFEATQDYKINSFEFDININDELATITGCARCKDGFFYDDQTQICRKLTDKECFYGYQLDNQMYCLYGIKTETNNPYSFQQGCEELKQKCQICLIGSIVEEYETFFCIICEEGYYSEKQTGQCVPCPLEYQCKVCEQRHNLAKDNWKTEILAFYRLFVDGFQQAHPFMQFGTTQNSEDYEIICLSCLEGYQLNNGLCIKVCPSNCLECIIVNNENVCIECPQTLNGKSLSLQQGDCILCPSNCELCRERELSEIYEINPLFNILNQDFSYFSNQCIGFHLCYDKLGFNYNYCYQMYQKQLIEINLNLACKGYDDQLIPIRIQQFQTKDFYLFLNLFQIQSIVIKIESKKQQSCRFFEEYTFSQVYSQNVFSIIDVQLEIYGNEITFFWSGNIQLNNFKKIHIEGIKLITTQFQINSIFEQTIELVNFHYSFGSIVGFENFITINNATNIQIDNFIVLFNQETNSPISKTLIEFGYTKSLQIIKISNFEIQIKEMKNDFFRFNLKQNDQVELSNINIFASGFFQSFLDIKNGNLIINKMQIVQNKIENSNFISTDGLSKFIAKSILIKQNQIYNATILTLTNNINISQLEITSNVLQNQSVLISNKNNSINLFQIQQISFNLNTYEYGSRFIIFNNNNNQKLNQDLIIKNISLIGNQINDIEKFQFDKTLIVFEFINIQIFLLEIQRLNGNSEFKFVGVQNLILNKTTIQKYSNYQEQKLFVIFECAQIKGLHQTSILIENTLNIELINLRIFHIDLMDYPIINIYQNKQESQFIQLLKLSKLNFYNNFLVTSGKQTATGIIYLMSQNIQISDSLFEKNLLHQYQENQLFISSLLFNLDCSLCTIHFRDLILESNLVTNSSSNIMFIKAKTIEFENLVFKNNCIFDYQILQPFLVFNFELEQNLTYDIITQMIQIKVTSGNAKLIGEQIKMKNISITNWSGFGFYIKMENEAIFLIENANFSNSNSNTNNGGILFIDSSQATSLIITANFVTMINIKNNNKGGFIYSLFGKGVTKIYLENLFVQNVYSLIGSLFYGEFETLDIYSSFTLNNLKMINTISEQLQFLNTFKNLNDDQQSAIVQLGSRSLFWILNFKIIILENLEITQLLYESVLTLKAAKFITIKNIKIIQSYFLNHAIYIDQMRSGSKLQFSNISISNITISNDINSPIQCLKDQSNIENQIKYKCSQQQSAQQNLVYFNNDTTEQGYCVLKAINNLKAPSQINLFMKNIQQTAIRLSQIKIQNTNSKLGGLLAFYYMDSFIDTSIDSLLIYQNFCGNLGCLIFENSNNYRILQSKEDFLLKQVYDLKLVNYICMYNFGNEGTCLFISNLSTLINSSVFKHNEARIQGGSITIIGNQKFVLIESIIINNTANFGGGLSINLQKTNQFYSFKNVIDQNIAKLFGNNYAQIPSQLTISLDTITGLDKVQIIKKKNLLIEQIAIKPYKLFKDTYSDILYVPNGQSLSQYEYFDWTQLKYFKYNMHFRIKALDKYNVSQKNLYNSTCDITGRIIDTNNENKFTSNFTNIQKVVFNSSDYNLDDLVVFLDDQLNLTLQLQFNCTSVSIPIYNDNLEITEYHNNYFLRINLKTLPCQFGEIKNQTTGICIICNATQGYYSLIINSNKCTIMDESKVDEVTSAQLKIKQGFWRPYFNTDNIQECINLIENCHGGWKVGDTSCFLGHIGALCEECDLYNLRGEGHYSISNKYQCGPCTDQELNAILIILISIWTIISDSQAGVLIKMLTNHLQVVSTITTFKFQLPQYLNNAINSSANPIQKMTYSLDCFLIVMFSYDIHYSRMIWQLILPLIYITLFLGFFFIGVLFNYLSYKVSVITTTFIYLYIYAQPNLIGGFLQLISFRSISGFKWIQANVAYRYDTSSHYFWLTTFCLPLILIIAILIPIILYLGMYFNKVKLNTKLMRQRLGYLYNEYKITAFFWEIVKIFQKELIIIFLTYYDEVIIKKGILVFLTVHIYERLNIKYQPYSSIKLNKIDAFSAQVCQISIILGLGIYIEQMSDIVEFQIPFLIMLAYLNIHFLLKLLFEIISQYLITFEVQLDSIRDTIRKKAPWTLKYSFLKKWLINRQQQKARVFKQFKVLKKYLFIKAKQIRQIKCQNNVFNDEEIKQIVNVQTLQKQLIILNSPNQYQCQISDIRQLN